MPALLDDSSGLVIRELILRVCRADPAVVDEDLYRSQVMRHVPDLNASPAETGEATRDEHLAAEVNAVLEHPTGLVGHQHPAQPLGLNDV